MITPEGGGAFNVIAGGAGFGTGFGGVEPVETAVVIVGLGGDCI